MIADRPLCLHRSRGAVTLTDGHRSRLCVTMRFPGLRGVSSGLPTIFTIMIVMIMMLMNASDARGQLPQAKLLHIFPMGGQAGTTTDIACGGVDLEGVQGIWCSHPGIRGFHLQGASFRITIAKDVPPGHYDLRLQGTFGITNARTFVVGQVAEKAETEPNNDRAALLAAAAPAATAHQLLIPSVMNGQINGAADTDWFWLEGQASQRILISLEANAVDSRLDGVLRLCDAAGNLLAESLNGPSREPMIDMILPAAGKYFVSVQDGIYAGSPEYGYRLSVNAGPWIDAVFPVSAAPDQEVTFTVYGRNLGGVPVTDLAIGLEGGAGLPGKPGPLERLEVKRRFPAIPRIAPNANAGDFPQDSRNHNGLQSGLDGWLFRITTPAGVSNALFLAAARDPVVAELEWPHSRIKPVPAPTSNPAQGKAKPEDPVQTVAVPCEISGAISAPNDRDIYQFSARKGQIFWIEADAEALGSSLDPAFIVRKLTPKAEPTDILTGDDRPDRGAGGRFHSASADASVQFTAPEDGDYQIVLRDAQGAARGDVRSRYRLRIRPLRPDYQLFVVPAGVAGPDGVTVRSGGRALVYVYAWRYDGFSAPIRLDAVNLPTGVTSTPSIIAANQNAAPLVIEAAPNALPGKFALTVEGRTRWADRKEMLESTPPASPPATGPTLGMTKDDASEVHQTMSAGMVWPSVSGDIANDPPPSRFTRGFWMYVGDPAPLGLDVGVTRWNVSQGQALPIPVTVRRGPGMDAPVVISAAEVSIPNFSIEPKLTLPKETPTGILPLFVAPNVPPGAYTFVLTATGPYPFTKDPKTTPKPNVNVVEPSRTVILAVEPAPVTVAVNNQGGAVSKDPAKPLLVDVTVTRINGFQGDATILLNAPPSAKLTATQVVIPAGQTAGKLPIHAAADSPKGAVAQAYVRILARVHPNSDPATVDAPVVLTVP